MKLFKLVVLVFTALFYNNSTAAQNVLMNILTQQSGVVKVGETTFIEITVNNTDPSRQITPYILRPQISIPANLHISNTAHVLPIGWAITSSSDSSITLTNGTDIIYPHEARTILIAIKGITTGGPYTISGSLLFSNGNEPGAAPGIPTPGDMPADNISTTTCRVVAQ